MSVFDDLHTMDSVSAAKRLLGCEIERTLDGVTLRARIVETEAYDQRDEASHSFNGMTKRSQVMFGPAGYAYVYFTYGMHYCCNVAVGPDGYGAAVLIRAVEPLKGEAYMQTRRSKHGVLLTNGPAKFSQAFAVDTSFNGHDLRNSPLKLIDGQSPNEIVTSTRIGISRAVDEPRRFYDGNSRYVSKR